MSALASPGAESPNDGGADGAGQGIAARVVLRPVANPLPLGFLGLAVATLLLSAQQLDWLPAGQAGVVGLILLGFVFPVQLLASIFGFLARDIVAGTGMGVLAGTWLSVGLVTLSSPPAPLPGATSRALALLLWLAAGAMLMPAAGAAIGKLVPAAVLTVTALKFATTGAYEWTTSTAWQVTAGWIGVLLCALAGYAALAMVLEDATHRTVLPLLRRAAGRGAMTRDLATQVRDIDHEAGIRDQL